LRERNDIHIFWGHSKDNINKQEKVAFFIKTNADLGKTPTTTIYSKRKILIKYTNSFFRARILLR
jgi:hypothetical protein